MKKITNIHIPCILLALAAIFTGCASKAVYVDSQGPDTIVSLDQIDIQDWNRAADEMVRDLISSGRLEMAPDSPAIMAVSRIINDTTYHVDTDLLIKKIRIALNQSGKVFTTSTIAYGNIEDPLAKELAAADASIPKQKTPYYTLSGKIIESYATAGRTKQITYTFQLSLTTVKDGIAIWEGERQITKQGKKNSIGW